MKELSDGLKGDKKEIKEVINEKIDRLKKMIEESSSIVFFGGAGVSTESGIPDFRSVDGLYHQHYDYPPEMMLSHSFFMRKTEEFFRFYRDKLIIEGVKPNITHYKLAELEEKGKLTAIVTQNIDGLHQMAGSKTVYELHGSTLRNYCTKCHKFYDINKIKNSVSLPLCDECNSLIKPDVVLYEEGLNEGVLSGAINAIRNADMLIVGGTSLVVYPAAGLLQYFNGKHLVLINKSETAYDGDAELCLHTGLGKVFAEL